MDKKLSNKAIKSWIIGRTIGLIIFISIYLVLRLVLPILEINAVNYILDNYIFWINMIILIKEKCHNSNCTNSKYKLIRGTYK